MTNRIYRVEVEMRGTIEILAGGEQEARDQAENVVAKAIVWSSGYGLYFREPELKPRRVLERGEAS